MDKFIKENKITVSIVTLIVIAFFIYPWVMRQYCANTAENRAVSMYQSLNEQSPGIYPDTYGSMTYNKDYYNSQYNLCLSVNGI